MRCGSPWPSSRSTVPSQSSSPAWTVGSGTHRCRARTSLRANQFGENLVHRSQSRTPHCGGLFCPGSRGSPWRQSSLAIDLGFEIEIFVARASRCCERVRAHDRVLWWIWASPCSPVGGGSLRRGIFGGSKRNFWHWGRRRSPAVTPNHWCRSLGRHSGGSRRWLSRRSSRESYFRRHYPSSGEGSTTAATLVEALFADTM